MFKALSASICSFSASNHMIWLCFRHKTVSLMLFPPLYLMKYFLKNAGICL